MSRFYWLLNIVLVVVFSGALMWVMTQQPDSRRDMPKRFSLGAAGVQGTVKGPAEGDLVVNPLAVNLDDLYKRSLFRPDRTEEIDVTGEEDDEKQSSAPQDMELIGIGIIGPESAAIILVKQTSRRRIRGRAASTQPEEKKPTRHVYRVGQTVENSGYVVKSIELQRVVLERGTEERVLELQHGDKGSQQRVASAEAETKQRAAEAAKKAPVVAKTSAAKLTPPPPPPPPPVTVPPRSATNAKTNGATTNSKKLTREERIRRALEARRRILERRKQQEATQ